MNKFKCSLMSFYRVATVLGLSFVAWKLVRHCRAGIAEKAGHAIDESIGVAAKKLEETAHALEEWAANGHDGENFGKGLDEVLTDTRKTLEKATDLVQHALNQTK